MINGRKTIGLFLSGITGDLQKGLCKAMYNSAKEHGYDAIFINFVGIIGADYADYAYHEEKLLDVIPFVRMNDFKTIKSIFSRKLRTAMLQYLITMAATVVFDLTKAILIGVIFSLIVFVVKVSDMQVTVAEVDPERIGTDKADPEKLKFTSVVYITGPLYFGTCSKLEEKIESLGDSYNIIFSMRGVTIADLSGIEALHEYCERLINEGRMVYFSCVQPSVMDLFERMGLKEERYKYKMFFWSTDKVFEHISSL